MDKPIYFIRFIYTWDNLILGFWSCIFNFRYQSKMDFIFFSQPQIFNKLKYIYASKYESEWYVVEMQNLKFFQCGQVLHFQQFQICNVKKKLNKTGANKLISPV